MLKKLFASPSDLLDSISERLPFLNWFTPLFMISSPLVVSFITVFPFALKVHVTPEQSPLELMMFVIPSSTYIGSELFLTAAILLFLCTISPVRARIGQYLAVSLAALLSILMVIFLWSKILLTNMMSIMFSVAYSAGRVHVHSPQFWVYFMSVGGTVLVLLNLITIVRQRKTA